MFLSSEASTFGIILIWLMHHIPLLSKLYLSCSFDLIVLAFSASKWFLKSLRGPRFPRLATVFPCRIGFDVFSTSSLSAPCTVSIYTHYHISPPQTLFLQRDLPMWLSSLTSGVSIIVFRWLYRHTRKQPVLWQCAGVTFYLVVKYSCRQWIELLLTTHRTSDQSSTPFNW